MRRKKRTNLNPEEVARFAIELREVMTSYDPSCILNMDETSWNFVFMNGDVLAATGDEVVHAQLPDDPRKSFTVLATISADGSRFPPLFLATRTTELCHRQFQDLKSPKQLYELYHSAHGYTNDDVMEFYFGLVHKWMGGKKCALILDRFRAHTSQKTRDNAAKYNIRLVFIPTSGTEKFQPLDIRVFGCLKSSGQCHFDQDLFKKQEGHSTSEAADVFINCWYRLSRDVINAA